MTAKRLRIAHGLFTWQEPQPMMEACLRSTAGIIDELIIADGLVQGIDPGGYPFLSDLSWLQDANYLPRSVPISAKEWRNLSSMCTWILHKAKQLDCDWLLYIDSDMELHNGDNLREWLAAYTGDAFPITRVDNGLRHACPWHLIRVSAFSRYVAGCFIVEHERFGECTLVPDGMPELAPESAPWISHHPERRPPGRHEIRFGYMETILEPPPHVPQVHLPGFSREPAAAT
jgi:hypothetical protein